MKKILTLILFLPVFAIGQNVTLNSAEATVAFDIDDVEGGAVSGIKIDADLNLDDPSSSSIKASADASTINTGIGDRDSHLKSGDYFDIEKYPEFTYETDKIVKTESGYMAYGKLTIVGITKDVNMPFIHKDGKLIGRMKIHTGSFGVHSEGEPEEGTFNCIIRIEVPVQ